MIEPFNPLVSIVVPVYNSEKFLDECINSLINQTYKNIELVLVNDGSTDNSLFLLKDFERQDKRIRVISKDNGGVSSARNLGLSIIDDDGYVMFVDSDDTISRNYIEKFVSKLDSDIDVVVELPSNQIQIFDKFLTKNDLFTFLYHYSEFRGPYRKLIKNGLAKEIMFDESIYVGEDLVFDARLFLMQKKCTFVENGGYNWQFNSNSLTHKKAKNNSLERYKRVFDTCYTWYIVFNLLNNASFLNSEELRIMCLNMLCGEYLEFYGCSFKYSRKYKREGFLEMKQINRANRIFVLYNPESKIEKRKKIMFCYFRPLYKMIRNIYKVVKK